MALQTHTKIVLRRFPNIRVWHLLFLIYWFSTKYKNFDTLCHYVFICFYVFLSYFSISSSIFKILGGIFIFNAFITFTALSLISVLTQILFSQSLQVSLIPNLTPSTLFIGIQLSSVFDRHQRLLFDFAVVTIWLNKMIVSLSSGVLGDFDVHEAKG